MENKYDELRVQLLKHATDIHDRYHAPWLDQKPLSKRNANKFVLGAILDYQILADQAWSNARRLAEQIVGDPEDLWDTLVASYTQDEWAAEWRLLKLHRFPAAHARVWRIGSEIVSSYGGDSRLIWSGKNAADVLNAFIKIRCGDEISRMMVGCLVTAGQLEGEGDVKADIHIRRVLGSVIDRDLSPYDARQLARSICPENPWQIDLPLYDIGKTLCRKNTIDCDYCPLIATCVTATLRE